MVIQSNLPFTQNKCIQMEVWNLKSIEKFKRWTLKYCLKSHVIYELSLGKKIHRSNVLSLVFTSLEGKKVHR